jgi:hypothetical protein
MVKILSREEVLSADDTRTEEVPTPEWEEDSAVLIRSLTARERALFEQSMIKIQGKVAVMNLADTYAQLVYLGCVNRDGSRMFTKKDIEALNGRSAAPMERIAKRVQELSGLREADIAELTANFTSGPTRDSTLD